MRQTDTWGATELRFPGIDGDGVGMFPRRGF